MGREVGVSGGGASPRIHPARLLGAFGALSGALVVGLKLGIDRLSLDLHLGWTVLGLDLSFDDLAIYPGLLFGIIIAIALMRLDRARVWQAAAYVLASTVSNFAATNLAYALYDGKNGLVTGITAGALGAAALTALTLAIMPFSRQLRAAVLMVVAGTALGALLSITLYLIDRDTVSAYLGLLILYIPWQGAFAAAFGMAVPNAAGVRSNP